MKIDRTILALLLVGLLAGEPVARAGSFVTGNTTLPATKTDRNPLQPGQDVTRSISAADINSIVGAAYDLRAHSSGWINAIEGGVACDGSTNDTAALGVAAGMAATFHVGLLISCKVRLTSAAGTLTVPIEFKGGGSLDLQTGGSVTLSGELVAGLHQIFYPNGGVLTFGAAVHQVYPQWWGAKTDGSDATSAIQAAINAAAGIDVVLPAGNYMITSISNLDGQSLRLRGAGRENTILRLTPGANYYAIALDRNVSANNHHISDLSIIGNSLAGGGIVMGYDDGLGTVHRSAWSRLSRLYITGFTLTGSSGIELDAVQEIVIDGVRSSGNYAGIRRPGINDIEATSIVVQGFDSYLGGNTYGALIQGPVPNISFRGVVFESNASAGLYVSSSHSSIIVDDCYFEANGHTGSPHLGAIYVDGLASPSRAKLVLMNSHFFRDAADRTDPTLTLGNVTDSLITGNRGLFREGGISTSSGTQAHFQDNSQPDSDDAGHPWSGADMVTIYQSLAGTISWSQFDISGIRHESGARTFDGTVVASTIDNSGGAISIGANTTGQTLGKSGTTLTVNSNATLNGTLGSGAQTVSGTSSITDSTDGTKLTVRRTGATNNPGLFVGVTESTKIVKLDASGSTSGFELDLATGGTARASITSTGIVASVPVQIGSSGTAVSASIRGTATLATSAINANLCAAEQSITVTGAATGAECLVGMPATIENGLIWSCYVSATNTAKLRVCNHTAGTITPAGSQTVAVRVLNP